MPPTPAANPMTAEQAQVLTEFARACRTAARSVSLYPATHPSIQASLSRVTSAATRLTPVREITLDGAPRHADDRRTGASATRSSHNELAGLMHDRLIGRPSCRARSRRTRLARLAPPARAIARGAHRRPGASPRRGQQPGATTSRSAKSTTPSCCASARVLGPSGTRSSRSVSEAMRTTSMRPPCCRCSSRSVTPRKFGELLERLQTIAELGEPTTERQSCGTPRARHSGCSTSRPDVPGTQDEKACCKPSQSRPPGSHPTCSSASSSSRAPPRASNPRSRPKSSSASRTQRSPRSWPDRSSRRAAHQRRLALALRAARSGPRPEGAAAGSGEGRSRREPARAAGRLRRAVAAGGRHAGVVLRRDVRVSRVRAGALERAHPGVGSRACLRRPSSIASTHLAGHG